MKSLAISPDLKLPIDAATQTFAFIARKGAGKTYAAGKLTELLLQAGVQVVVLDTVGNWYGLRLAADGKGKGFDVPVFGGLRGDLPLQSQAGELVADVAVDTGRSLILDLSQFSLADRKRFATAFGERLWKKKKAESHPSPLMLVIEESQLIIPQFTGGGDVARMVGIYEEIIRLGRNYGIGCTMISQRPQSVNKEVLNQTECLFVLQVNGAQERKALKDWITHQGMDPALLDELPSLPIGTAYVWSPQWLGILKKVPIGKKITFDASATPKVGDKSVRRDPAPLDLGELEKQMAATIETAKQNDPRELKKQLHDARREIADLQVRLEEKPTAVTKMKEVEVIKPTQIDRLEKLLPKFESLFAFAGTQLQEQIQLATAIVTPIREALARISSGGVEARHAMTPRAGLAPSVRNGNSGRTDPPRASSVAPARNTSSESAGVTKAEKRVLDAVAWWQSAGVAGPTRHQVAFVAGYTVNGHFNNLVGGLRTKGLVDYPAGGGVALTEQGQSVAIVDEVPSRSALIEKVTGVLKGDSLKKIFRAVVDAGRDLTRDELAAMTGYTVNGHFNNMVGSLRSIGVFEYPHGGGVRLSALFDALPA